MADGDVPRFTVFSGTCRTENGAGSWEGASVGLSRDTTTNTVTDTAVPVGSGAHEGIRTHVVFDLTQRPVIVVGAVLPGELPTVATFE